MRRDSRRDYTEFAAVQTKGAFSPQRNRWFADSLLEGTGFEPSGPPRKRRPSREAPRPTIVVSRDDLRLMTPSNLSVRHLSSATAERPFTRAGANHRFLSCSAPSVDGRGSSSSCSTWSGDFRGSPVATDGEELQEIAGFSRDIEKSLARGTLDFFLCGLELRPRRVRKLSVPLALGTCP